MSDFARSIKNRCSVRCDSSESCDSGLVCSSDTSSCSSCSDVTEPISPSSSQSAGCDIVEMVTSAKDESQSVSSSFIKPMDINQLCEKTKKSAFLIPDFLVDHQNIHLLEAQTSQGTPRRKRRHSESFSSEPSRVSGRGQTYFNDERHRRFSGDVAIKTPATVGDCGNQPTDLCSELSFPVYKGIAWNYERKEPTELAIKSQFQSRSLRPRISWPFSRRSLSEQSRNGQTKITEYFPNQVKQKWNFMKPCSALKRTISKTLDVGVIAQPTAVAPVSQNYHLNKPQNYERHLAATEAQNNFCPPIQNMCFNDVSVKSIDIRFPSLKPYSGSKNQTSGDMPNEETYPRCKWVDCDVSLSPGQSLLEHIQTVHVASQYRKNGWKSLLPKSVSPVIASQGNNISGEVYVCQWEGCKVQGRSSSSRAWLERHVLLHGGHKPFRCIVDSCEQRFNSQVALQRHVNAHLNQGTCGANPTHVIKRDITSKIARRNSKKYRNRISKVSPGRLFDYFDAGIMERLQHQLLFSQMSQKHSGIVFVNGKITVRSEVIARRLDMCGKPRVLLRWYPENILSDQWVVEEEVLPYRTVPIHDLSHTTKLHLENMLNKTSSCRRRRK